MVEVREALSADPEATTDPDIQFPHPSRRGRTILVASAVGAVTGALGSVLAAFVMGTPENTGAFMAGGIPGGAVLFGGIAAEATRKD